MTIQPKLPAELWIQIFQYLSADDILKLTQVSRLYRDIVSKSSLLTSKLTLRFSKRHSYCHMGRRRYGKLNVSYVKDSLYCNILKFIGTDITELTFSCYNFTFNSIRQILVLCENVKVLKFSFILRLHGMQEVSGNEKLPKYRNIELAVDQCDPRIFKVLRNVQARKFQATCVEFAHRQHFVDMVEFLRAQRELVELKLAEFSGKEWKLRVFWWTILWESFVTFCHAFVNFWLFRSFFFSFPVQNSNNFPYFDSTCQYPPKSLIHSFPIHNSTQVTWKKNPTTLNLRFRQAVFSSIFFLRLFFLLIYCIIYTDEDEKKKKKLKKNMLNATHEFSHPAWLLISRFTPNGAQLFRVFQGHVRLCCALMKARGLFLIVFFYWILNK